MKIETKYTEIFKLKNMLEEAKIPHRFINWQNKWFRYEKYQIVYPNVEPPNCICSCIEGSGSYGEQYDLLEIRWRNERNATYYYGIYTNER